jgi:hypothetical protein
MREASHHTHKESPMGDKSDTPFHLRMTCFSMAEQMLSQKMHMTKDVHGNDKVEFFTTEDVMAEAAKLYRFVCDKNAAETYNPGALSAQKG